MPAATRPCETRDPEWWDTGNDGNRLALLLCKICPGCPDNDPHPHGVIRNGTAYSDDGLTIALCPCGYPARSPIRPDRPKQPDVQLCRRCQPPRIDPYRYMIIRWRAANPPVLYREIARRIGHRPEHVRKKHLAWTTDQKAEPE